MTAFATADDLATRLGLTFSDDEAARATDLLADATGLIQEEANQIVFLVTDDVLEVPGTTDDRIRLPQRPVVSITSITLNGRPLVEGVDWYLNGNTIFRRSTLFSPFGTLDGPFLLGTGFGRPDQTLTIVYTHGYDVLPAVVKTICKEVVVRVWINPGSVARETVGSVMTTYDNMRFSPTGLLLTDVEILKIKRFFGQRAASVAIL